MCLILFAFRQHPDFPLVVIANRDEYYARPTRAAHWWDEAPAFGGRDLEAGGTWLGVDRGGRFAAVTNVREPGGMKAGKRSRGELPMNYLTGSMAAPDYLESLMPRDREYAGFNLLLGGADGLWFYSNRDHGMRRVEAGVYGVSNGGFDEAWPKLRSGRDELAALLRGPFDESDLLEILTDHQVAQDHELPETGVGRDIERLLSSRFIRSPAYGTRACTVVTISAQGELRFTEQNFVDAERVGELVREGFDILPGQSYPE